MTDWRDSLKAWDSTHDAVADPERLRTIRAQVVHAAARSSSPLRWQLPLAMTAAAAALLVASAAQYVPTLEPQPAAPVVRPAERRQIQFSTPGGTRIIWELNPEFKLTETLP